MMQMKVAGPRVLISWFLVKMAAHQYFVPFFEAALLAQPLPKTSTTIDQAHVWGKAHPLIFNAHWLRPIF
ncbi:hypothetical protein [Paracnuella aquatica]|uniref:hypothetical protein n=1 Tax=Paracnuella aquatica TaxID=2268757 RepID=UPI000F4DEF65|nr:hypothetical protein [Paracnuella aquatica]RPD50890.1 hypothetical protein DRJ53_05190 [Paracnuella aquatica]